MTHCPYLLELFPRDEVVVLLSLLNVFEGARGVGDLALEEISVL